jgi:hypothetical protein
MVGEVAVLDEAAVLGEGVVFGEAAVVDEPPPHAVASSTTPAVKARAPAHRGVGRDQRARRPVLSLMYRMHMTMRHRCHRGIRRLS